MADERSIADRLLDYGVYAPIGIAISVVEELPKLADKGRRRAGGQIHVARMMGKLVVREAQTRLSGQSRPAHAPGEAARPQGGSAPAQPSRSRLVPDARLQPAGGLNGSGGSRRRPDRSSAPADASSDGAGVLATHEEGRGGIAPTVSVPKAHRPVRPPPLAESLAIPGYDTLAASQVVQRLSSLRADELDAIARYEAATRGRRTILHRIGQLRADG